MATPTPKIKIDDDGLRKVRSSSTEIERPFGGTVASSSGIAGGIYHARTVSYVPAARRSSLSRVVSSTAQPETAADTEDGGEWNRDSGRKKQVFRGTTLLWYAASQ
jgi:hypothetical protein